MVDPATERLDAEIVVVLCPRPGKDLCCFFILSAVCHVRMMTSPSAAHCLASPTTSSRARRDRAGCPRPRSSPCGCGSRRRPSPRRWSGSRWWHTISMSRCSSMRVACERPRGIGGRGKYVRLSTSLNDVRRVSTTRSFGVIGVNCTTFKRSKRIFHKAALVQRIGVDGDLNVVFLGNG